MPTSGGLQNNNNKSWTTKTKRDRQNTNMRQAEDKKEKHQSIISPSTYVPLLRRDALGLQDPDGEGVVGSSRHL